mgnify:CR=1 FL=1
MTVGKPDFNLNSFGIQYKEKKVKYTEDLMKDGIEGGGKNTPEFGKTQPQHKEGQATEARSVSDKRELPYEQRPRMSIFDKKPKGKPPVKKPYNNKKPDSRIPEKELTEIESNRIITTGLGDASEPNAKNSFIGGSGAPADLKRKAAETILKAILLKLDLMKNTPKKGGKELPQDFIGQTMGAKNGKMTKEKPLTEYDNYDNKHGLTARTERHRGNTLRHKKRDVKVGSSMDVQGMTPPAGSSLMDEIGAKVPKGTKSPNDLGKSSAETVLKAILLKLDLTSLK